MSHINNLDLWKKYDYKTLGIIGDPYLDVDYTQVFYLTDTGRKWNHAGASIRDRVASGFDIPIKNTAHLIALIEKVALPDKVMINMHPQRWTDEWGAWGKELVWRNVKNVVKRVWHI